MLFLLKRSWSTSLLGLAVLAGLGLILRQFVPAPTPLNFSLTNLALGVLTVGAVLGSDGLIHLILLLAFREKYACRHRELVEVFRGQSIPAMFWGAVMAGLGEELVFRGLGMQPTLLGVSAVVFGLLHHIRRDLWPFTVWACWQGLLFAAALMLTGSLAATMTAHFLHDLIGFLIFRFLQGQSR